LKECRLRFIFSKGKFPILGGRLLKGLSPEEYLLNEMFPILGGRLLKFWFAILDAGLSVVSNPWREAIEVAKKAGETETSWKFPILGGRLLKKI